MLSCFTISNRRKLCEYFPSFSWNWVKIKSPSTENFPVNLNWLIHHWSQFDCWKRMSIFGTLYTCGRRKLSQILLNFSWVDCCHRSISFSRRGAVWCRLTLGKDLHTISELIATFQNLFHQFKLLNTELVVVLGRVYYFRVSSISGLQRLDFKLFRIKLENGKSIVGF